MSNNWGAVHENNNTYIVVFLFVKILIFQSIIIYTKCIGQGRVTIKHHFENKVLLAWVIQSGIKIRKNIIKGFGELVHEK